MGAQVLNVHVRGAIKPLSVSAQPSFNRNVVVLMVLISCEHNFMGGEAGGKRRANSPCCVLAQQLTGARTPSQHNEPV